MEQEEKEEVQQEVVGGVKMLQTAMVEGAVEWMGKISRDMGSLRKTIFQRFISNVLP